MAKKIKIDFNSKNKKDFINFRNIKGELNSELEGIFGKEELEKFKKFAFQQRIYDLIIGFTLGSACKSLAAGISEYMIMPIVSFLSNLSKEEWDKFSYSPVDGLDFQIGKVINLSVEFFIISLILYLIFYKFIKNKDPKKEENESKEEKNEEPVSLCSDCKSIVNNYAKRCHYCTSWLDDSEIEKKETEKEIEKDA